MSLISARAVFRSNQLFKETFKHFHQRLATMTTAKNRFLSSTATEQPVTNQPPPNSGEKVDEAISKDLTKLNEEIANLSKQNTDLVDKYKRALADGENLRNRLTKQIADAKIFGIQSFCKDLLDVADVLGKATESVPKDEISDENPHLKTLYEGLIMTEAQLKKVFQRHGLEVVNPMDDKFNPNLHEALFQQEVQGKDSGTVVVVSKIGYKLHERVIRPALVGVAK